MKIAKILTYKGLLNVFSAPGLKAITPLGLKIRARNDRYNTSRPKIWQKPRNDRYNTTLSKSRPVL